MIMSCVSGHLWIGHIFLSILEGERRKWHNDIGTRLHTSLKNGRFGFFSVGCKTGKGTNFCIESNILPSLSEYLPMGCHGS